MEEKEKIFKAVSGYLTKDFEVPAQKIKPEANLFKDLGLDSIDALDWFATMESTLGLPIVEEEIKSVRTVMDVVNYVIRNLPRDAE